MSRSLSEEFVPEAEELLERMETDVQELGREGQPPERIAERLNALFRSAHSLKGMAGMAGLTEISHLSHEMENLMDHLRMGRLHPEPSILDLIGDGITLLRKSVAAVAAGGKGGRSASAGIGETEVGAYAARVAQALAAPPAAGGTSLAALGIPPHLTAALTTYEEHRLRENLRLGRTIYAVRVRFGFEDFERQLAAVTGRLQEIGELITTVPQIQA
ncbi:MAG: Hpt domain-containing protein, partial [Nitrospirota bacterium]